VLPVMRPTLPPVEAFLPRLHQIEESGVFSNYGPQLEELHTRFAKRLNVKPDQVLVLANATLAIAGLAQLLDSQHFRVPSWTFAATALSVLQAGKDLTFADVDYESHRVKIECDSGPTIATLPFGVGLPEAWQNASDFPHIIDGAASLGSVTDLSDLPTHSSIVFSLHATKYLGVGEGALVVAGDPAIAAQLKSWSNFGFDGTRSSVQLGTNAKMSEFQAAVAHAALDHEPNEHRSWGLLRKRARQVEESLKIGISSLSDNSIAPYWIVNFQSAARREAAETALRDASIDCRRWWASGCHVMPALRSCAREGELANTEALANHTLGLPFFIGMEEDDFDAISSCLSPVI